MDQRWVDRELSRGQAWLRSQAGRRGKEGRGDWRMLWDGGAGGLIALGGRGINEWGTRGCHLVGNGSGAGQGRFE